MKIRIIISFLVLLPVTSIAQQGFRSIIDSSVTCSYYNYTYEYSESPFASKQTLEIFYIVERMPKPKTSTNEIEKELSDHIRFNDQELNLRGKILIQCVVNCKGKAGDFQIINCPPELVNIGCQVLNVLEDRFYDWESGVQRGRKVDMLIRIRVGISDSTIRVDAPLI